MHLVITDLDGTLLDHDTYSFEDARPAIETLRQRRIPLVLCTSKTLAEVEVWRRRLGNQDPFIAENGGAVFIPSGRFPLRIASALTVGEYEVLQLGSPYSTLVEALHEAARESGCRVLGFSDMTAQEVAEACGMSVETAALAKRREYDEPFLIQDADRSDSLVAAIEKRGFHWTRGGRFHHIIGESDKAKAVELLVGLYRKPDPGLVTIGPRRRAKRCVIPAQSRHPDSDPDTAGGAVAGRSATRRSHSLHRPARMESRLSSKRSAPSGSLLGSGAVGRG